MAYMRMITNLSAFLWALVMGPLILVGSVIWYIIGIYWGPDQGPILGLIGKPFQNNYQYNGPIFLIIADIAIVSCTSSIPKNSRA